jgi:hypothetical protein
MTSHLLQRGMALWKQGKQEEARTIFQAVIRNDRANESAWLWHIYSLETGGEKIAALEEFLKIAPENEKARMALEELRAEEREKTAPLHAVHIQKQGEPPPEPLDLSDPDHPVERKGPKLPRLTPWALLLGAASLLDLLHYR